MKKQIMKVIEKAKDSAHSVGATVQNHFVDVNKMLISNCGKLDKKSEEKL